MLQEPTLGFFPLVSYSCRRFVSGRFPGKRSEKLFEFHHAIVARAVDEKTRRAIDPAAGSTVKVLPDAKPMRAGRNFVHQPLRIQSQGRSVARQILVMQGLLVLI